MIAAVLRQSRYTILVLIVTAAALLWMLPGARAAGVASLAFSSLGVVVCAVAFASAKWRRNAGPWRHTLVTLGGAVCLAVVVRHLVETLGGG